VLPAVGCTLGTLTAGSWSTALGTLTSTTAAYSEVGGFSFRLFDATFASVDAADSSVAERSIESAAVSVGRFVPDHFQLSTLNTPHFVTFNDAACATRSFTYVGQPFGYGTLPQVAITARNAGGGITTNYQGLLWKLTGTDATLLYTAAAGALDTGLIDIPTIAVSGNGVGTLTASHADLLAFQRDTTTPQSPFNGDITLTVSVTDDDEAGVASNGTVGTAIPAVFTDIAFDASDLFRYGRLRMQNAYGSELRELPIPMQTEYWNGVSFALNGDDHCTTVLGSQIARSNYQRNLTEGDSNVLIGGRFAAGRGDLRLTAPGPGNSGSMDLTVDLVGIAWLQGRWRGTDFDDNPTARASFGIRNSSGGFVYSRENY
jgi:MSHA biogenesis protein MshQ